MLKLVDDPMPTREQVLALLERAQEQLRDYCLEISVAEHKRRARIERRLNQGAEEE